MNPRIALLCGRGDSSAAVANALKARFGALAVVVERPEGRMLFLKRRLKRLGALELAGQLAFKAAVLPVLKRRSRTRRAEILAQSGMDADPAVLDQALQVQSVNSAEVVEWLRHNRPEVVVVNGTRIIGKRVLEATDAVFINTHCGITPEYRGVHGGYWALASGDRENCGVTVHLVDTGIDTGDILFQSKVEPQPGDNFVTYPYLQLAAALPNLLAAVDNALEGRLRPFRRETSSRLWSHPTLWGYLGAGMRRSIW